jgi:hypothetical protein
MNQALAAIFVVLFQFSTLLAQDAPGKSGPPSASAKTGAQLPASSATPPTPTTPPPQTSGKDTPQGGPAQAPAPPTTHRKPTSFSTTASPCALKTTVAASADRRANQDHQRERRAGASANSKSATARSATSSDIPTCASHKPDGTVVTCAGVGDTGPDLSDAPVYTDYHEKHISVPSLRPGDVLEYRFVRTIASPLSPRDNSGPASTSPEQGIILDEELEINVPKDRQIKLKTKPGYDPKDHGRWRPPYLSLDALTPERRRSGCQEKEEESQQSGRRNPLRSTDHV